MSNIKFNYLYRDGGNYKTFNSVIFKNDPSISIKELGNLIRSKLIYAEWFYAERWKLPELFTGYFDFKTDPTWHEFESVEHTDEPVNSSIPLKEFIEIVSNTNWTY